MKVIQGGVCATPGFQAYGVHCGVKTNNPKKKDLALIVADQLCQAEAIYTQNHIKGAPLLVTQKHLQNGQAQAVIVNSGNANVCAADGEENALKMCTLASASLGIPQENVVVSSTGVIGERLNIENIEKGVPELVSGLSYEGSTDAAEAILTTDTTKKECALKVSLGGKTIHLGGIAKGSGMIHPNMGTMLCFLTTDCAISSKMIRQALLEANRVSFNRVSIDHDTSTSDMCVLLASGSANNPLIVEKNEDYHTFVEALKLLCTYFAKEIAADGEGAEHFITCAVESAKSEQEAELLAKSVISSTLFKAAIFGKDANWGRVIAALGTSGVSFEPENVSISFQSKVGKIDVCQNGQGMLFDEELAKEILSEREVEVIVDLGQNGQERCSCWGCDMTYEYIQINGDYRT